MTSPHSMFRGANVRRLVPGGLGFVVIAAAASAAAAETPVVVSTPGSAFSAEGRGARQVAVDDVASGRRFHGKEERAEVILSGNLRMPPVGVAEPTMQGLTIHFETNQSGASLQSIELRNGGKVEFHFETNLQGDYRTKVTSKPDAVANSWSFPSTPIRVSSSSVIRCKVRFAGGVDSRVDPGDFLMVDVRADFPRKPISLAGTRASRDLAQVLTFQRALPSASPAPQAASVGVIYVLDDKDRLQWYAHTGFEDGSFRWLAPEGRTVGSGWAFKKVLSGGGGVIYAITQEGDLLWYHHDGKGDGSFRWAAAQGKKIAAGWTYRDVFSAGNGTLYALTAKDELLMFRHEGHADGSATWAVPAGQLAGTGWRFKHVFSSGSGAIYAVTAAGDLLWFGQNNVEDNRQTWRAGDGKKIASGWDYPHMFSAAGGVIYAITPSGDLLWFRHEGWANGEPRWTAPQGRKVGTGWVVKDIFSGS